MMLMEKHSWLAPRIIASVARRRVSNGDAACLHTQTDCVVCPAGCGFHQAVGCLEDCLLASAHRTKVVIRTRFVRPTTMLPERATLRPALRVEEPAAREPGSGGWG